MKKNFLYKKVRLFDEDYTIGGIIVVFLGLTAFLFLCGLAESL